LLDLREVTTLADYFLICSASNQKQAQAIWDEIAKQMKEQRGDRAIRVEGYGGGRMDCRRLRRPDRARVHAGAARLYDLERLWRHAANVPLPA